MCHVVNKLANAARILSKMRHYVNKKTLINLLSVRFPNLWATQNDKIFFLKYQYFNPFNTDLLQCTMQILFKTKQLNVISEVFIKFKKSF